MVGQAWVSYQPRLPLGFSGQGWGGCPLGVDWQPRVVGNSESNSLKEAGQEEKVLGGQQMTRKQNEVSAKIRTQCCGSTEGKGREVGKVSQRLRLQD